MIFQYNSNLLNFTTSLEALQSNEYFGSLMPVAYFWSFGHLVACVLGRSGEYGPEIAASRLGKSRCQVELNSTGSDRVILGLRPAATSI